MTKASVTSGDVGAAGASVAIGGQSYIFAGSERVAQKRVSACSTPPKRSGYRPNAIARAMISGRSRLIAILVAYLDNQFYPLVLEQMARALQENGYQILLFMTDPGDQDMVVQNILQYQVDGIVMASATLSSKLASECIDTGTPVVLFNRYVPSSPTSSVTSDNIEGGRLLAHFLADNGHRRIAFIAGNEDSSTSRDRESGFYKGLAERGLAVFSRVVGGYSFEGATMATRLLLGQKIKPDAIFVANDHMAFATMDVIRNEFGLRIPEDISIVGYDDVPEAGWGGYRLTTVEQPSQAMVDATVSILLEQIEEKTVTRRAAVLPARLVVRTSARLAKT